MTRRMGDALWARCHQQCRTRQPTSAATPPRRYYDIVVGTGPEPQVGARVAVHYDVKFR